MTREEFLTLKQGDIVKDLNEYGVIERIEPRQDEGLLDIIHAFWFKDKELKIPWQTPKRTYSASITHLILICRKKIPIESDPEYSDLFI